MIALRQFQQDVARTWKVHQPVKQHRAIDGVAAAAKLAEEAGETAQVVLLTEGWGIDSTIREEDALERLSDELGDVLFVVARLANCYQLDIEQAAGAALERFRRRVGG